MSLGAHLDPVARPSELPSLSRLTVLYSIFLPGSALFMRQLLDLFRTNLGGDLVAPAIWVAFNALFVTMWYLARGAAALGILSAIVVCGFGLAVAYTFEITEERVHLIKYGALGFLVFRDLGRWYGSWSLLLAAVYAFGIAGIDESIQFYLPYRVGDIRDVIFGGLGGVWGALIAASLFRGRPLRGAGHPKSVGVPEAP